MMNPRVLIWRIALFLMICTSSGSLFAAERGDGVVSENPMKWHRVTLTFTGPECSEEGEENPFLDYRLTVTFSHETSGTAYHVPGFFAADGNAANSSASSGNVWQARFMPDETGEWRYEASLRKGKDIALVQDGSAGEPVELRPAKGTFHVAESDKSAPDFRARGGLKYVGQHYLQFAETGEYFIKGGADSPENFLAYYEFDQTYRMDANTREGEAKVQTEIHHYQPHSEDWKAGDPIWKEGKGKNIIGALNYLAEKGMNSVYFLTMNVEGDGKDVWTWTAPDERFRFDVSKLEQWEIVFTHMDQLGLLMHVITQETENDQLLDGGELGRERKLYYRELIARFAHHPALVWNLGEENTNTTEQLQAFAAYIQALDPYQHPIVVHTYPGRYDEVYTPLLGYEHFHGPSLQMGNMKQVHSETIKWIDRSAEDGRKWFVSLDEIGPANTGVMPDADDPGHDEVRHFALWGNLMAGGAGVEWYFGYKFPHNDLNLNDFRSRDRMWDQTRYALEFFHRYLPFTEMKHADELTPQVNDYVFAQPGVVYAIYLPQGGEAVLQLEEGDYEVGWYNPREGGELHTGNVSRVSGPGVQSLGTPPDDEAQDWVVLVRKIENQPQSQK